jgi:peptide/nickel transport system permease protein
MSALLPDDVQTIDPPAESDGGVFTQKRLGPVFWLSVGWLALISGLAILAPLLPIPDPNRSGFTCARCAPFDGSLLGGDSLGRDIFSRLVWGARVSLVVGVCSIALGLLIGGFLGVVAGYLRGRIEGLIMGAMDALLAFPALVLLLALVTFVADNNANIAHITASIGLLTIAPTCRVVRALTLRIAEREFVQAARTMGSTHRRIISHEIVPNVAIPAFTFALTAVAFAIVAEGGLAFLGLSVRPPTATWGGMINDGRLVLRDASHVALIPAAAMFLTVLALNFAGDCLTSKYQVKEGAL